jgi:peptidoglycan-N-acetylglucosamine deacetylase
MTPTHRVALAATMPALGLGLLHMAPWVTAIAPLRTRLLPDLAGVGRPGSVAVTFDDGPDPTSTPQILDELDRTVMPATFFVLASMVEKHPELTRELVARGHEVGLHGYAHRSHLTIRPAAIYDDLRRGAEVIADATQRPVTYFRPPYGSISGGTVAATHRLHLRTVLWTAWGRDWRAAATPSTVLADVARDLGEGATILLHDSDCTSSPKSWRATHGALDPLAELFEQRKLRPSTLSDHLNSGHST